MVVDFANINLVKCLDHVFECHPEDSIISCIVVQLLSQLIGPIV